MAPERLQRPEPRQSDLTLNSSKGSLWVQRALEVSALVWTLVRAEHVDDAEERDGADAKGGPVHLQVDGLDDCDVAGGQENAGSGRENLADRGFHVLSLLKCSWSLAMSSDVARLRGISGSRAAARSSGVRGRGGSGLPATRENWRRMSDPNQPALSFMVPFLHSGTRGAEMDVGDWQGR